MKHRPLSTLIIAAAGTVALSLASANLSAQTAGANGQKKVTTPPVAKPAVPTDPNVVGICNKHNITWDTLVAKIQKDNPALLTQSIAAIVAERATTAFFGNAPKPSFTITKAEALVALRDKPTQQISQQLELMLTQMAVDDEATAKKVQPTPEQVNDKVAGLLKTLRENGTIKKGQTDAQFLAEHKVTLETLRGNYRPQCQVLNLINLDVQASLGHPIGPDDMVQASHILIQPKSVEPSATKAEKDKAEEEVVTKIKAVYADIKAGKVTFADAANLNSDDPGTKQKGGDLGIFMRGAMVADFDKAAFSAKPNEMTLPFHSEFGWHIILVTKLGKDIPPAERQKAIDQFEESKIQTYLQKVIDKDNNVKNLLAERVPKPGSPLSFGGPQGGRPQVQ